MDQPPRADHRVTGRRSRRETSAPPGLRSPFMDRLRWARLTNPRGFRDQTASVVVGKAPRDPCAESLPESGLVAENWLCFLHVGLGEWLRFAPDSGRLGVR